MQGRGASPTAAFSSAGALLQGPPGRDLGRPRSAQALGKRASSPGALSMRLHSSSWSKSPSQVFAVSYSRISCVLALQVLVSVTQVTLEVRSSFGVGFCERPGPLCAVWPQLGLLVSAKLKHVHRAFRGSEAPSVGTHSWFSPARHVPPGAACGCAWVGVPALLGLPHCLHQAFPFSTQTRSCWSFGLRFGRTDELSITFFLCSYSPVQFLRQSLSPLEMK